MIYYKLPPCLYTQQQRRLLLPGSGRLQPAADATWRPEMNYRRFRVPTAMRCCSCFYTVFYLLYGVSEGTPWQMIFRGKQRGDYDDVDDVVSGRW